MTTEQSRAYVHGYLQAAEESLQEASVLFEKSLLKGAANRAYYAMFYAASAALVAEKVPLPRKHRTVINLFHQQFIRSGRMARALQQNLMEAFQLRQRGDYEIHAHIGEDEVQDALDKAGAFVAEVKRALETK